MKKEVREQRKRFEANEEARIRERAKLHQKMQDDIAKGKQKTLTGGNKNTK